MFVSTTTVFSLCHKEMSILSLIYSKCFWLQPSSNKEVPLEDEPWYHGALPRQETEELLKNEGDFIVRFKSDASGQYVLSCRSSDKLRHFPIVKQEDGTVSFTYIFIPGVFLFLHITQNNNWAIVIFFSLNQSRYPLSAVDSSNWESMS